MLMKNALKYDGIYTERTFFISLIVFIAVECGEKKGQLNSA